MPDPVTHYVFGTQLLSRLPSEVRDNIDLPIFERAVQGPDPWSTLGFWGGKNKRYAVRSSIMHKQNTGAFLRALMQEAKGDCAKLTFSVLAGFLCHYCLDKNAHPFIICKGGEYDGTKETYHLRGGHVRLERSIDSLYIRRVYKKAPWRFSLAKNIFRLKQLPEGLRLPLERAFKQVYNWDNGFDLFNRALWYERIFYTLMQDPFGLVQTLFRPLSHGSNNYCVYSYYRRETDPKILDYLNEKHTTWHHPLDHSLSYTDSFFDLLEKSEKEAKEMITDAYNSIFCGQETGELPFLNYNYSTGFMCDDSRNKNAPAFEPLVYKNYYQNT